MLLIRAAIMLSMTTAGSSAQEKSSEFQPPDDVAFRKNVIVSEGTRVAAEVFAP